MNADEVNNLLSVMQKRITELTSQNIMLEAKIMYLNTVINSMNKVNPPISDGGSFDEEVTDNNSKEITKSRRSA